MGASGLRPAGPSKTSSASSPRQLPRPVEIDAVALAGRAREAVLVGESKWERRVDARRIRRELERKAEALPNRREPLQFAIGAGETVENVEPDILPLTARDIFR